MLFLLLLFITITLTFSTNITTFSLTVNDLSRCTVPLSICHMDRNKIFQFTRKLNVNIYYPSNTTNGETYNLIVAVHKYHPNTTWDNSMRILSQNNNIVVDVTQPFAISSSKDTVLDYICITNEIRSLSKSNYSSIYGLVNNCTLYLGYGEYASYLSSIFLPDYKTLIPPGYFGLILISPSYNSDSLQSLNNAPYNIPILFISSDEDCQRSTYSHTVPLYTYTRPLTYETRNIMQMKILIEFQHCLTCDIYDHIVRVECIFNELSCNAKPTKSYTQSFNEILSVINAFSNVILANSLNLAGDVQFQALLENLSAAPLSNGTLQYLEYWMLPNQTVITNSKTFLYRQLYFP